LVEGVDWLITCGTSIESSLRNVELSQKSSKVFVGVGAGYEPGGASLVEMRKKLLDMADGEKVVGIGECGLNSGGFEEEKFCDRACLPAQNTKSAHLVRILYFVLGQKVTCVYESENHL
jgi:Tat protein secretion system quality control protein TatD with DNase activity